MTWTAPKITRTEPLAALDERSMLEGWLDYHRQTLLWKCEGLTAEQLRQRSVEPSSLSLLGLVRHMTEVERWWLRTSFDGQRIGHVYVTDEEEDWDFDGVDGADPEADFAAFREEVKLADEAAKGRSLDDTFTTRRGKELNLRWIYNHMIEEYARHNGHADLLRERIDGATGE